MRQTMAARYGSEVKTPGQAWREFQAKRSPRILAAGIAIVLVLRLALGGFERHLHRRR